MTVEGRQWLKSINIGTRQYQVYRESNGIIRILQFTAGGGCIAFTWSLIAGHL